MTILIASILMVLLVVLSNIISHYLVSIPTALIEIGVGLLIALIFNFQIQMESDWFMLLFVAPLLFNDGKLFPKNELWELKAPIFAYAIWLVLLTTVVGGYFIHWLIPAFPLPLAMALVAVLSPTDPVAVHGIAEQIKLPKKILSLISGESLINDASGLIAFKYALAAFMTGQFSLAHATIDFFYMAIAGVVIGVLSMMLIHFLRMLLVQQGIQDAILHTTIQLLTPFLIYILADEIAHASGVIAVVSAGLISINQAPIFRSQYSEVRLITNKMWDMMVYLLNGLIFVLLGLQLPVAMKETLADPTIHNSTLLKYILSIWFFLLVIRVIWSYLYMWLTNLKKDEKTTRPSFNKALMTGLTGVRGAISMATIMSVPYFLPNGESFSQRSLVITIACGVVLTSLIVATVTLPILTKKKIRLPLVGNEPMSKSDDFYEYHKEEQENKLTELEARQLMVKEALVTLKREAATAEQPLIVSDLIHEFEARLRHLYREHNDDQTNLHYSKIERKVQEIAVNGENSAIQELVEHDEVSKTLAKQYTKILQMKRVSFEPGFINSIKRYFFVLRKQGNLAFWRMKAAQHDEEAILGDTSILMLEEASTLGAITSLQAYKKTLIPDSEAYELHKHIANQKLHEYLHKLHRLRQASEISKKDYQKLVQEFYMKAIDSEREIVQELFQDGRITLSMLNHLRQSLNYYESSLLQTRSNH
ncbi:Na+/H+ antiporter [Vagococcus coleopterorum]|uniref:Na+/H+ antiporter n=1 Tax=Vagococcus coleopterorum TaxID=2714946 RepID=A0A6G8AMV8_9ENTE|nr:Na+/H+ antiporter [Vagococcus coleopterorum]QIL46299.1 Na+/H+ antiporter [Vagococcus coleopterorum]